MKKHFITGLVILLPLTLTVLVVVFLFNFLTTPFMGVAQRILDHLSLFQNGFLFLTAEQVHKYASKLFVIFFLFIFTVLLGAVARWFLIRYFLHVWDFILHRIPFVSVIYKTSQDVINTIFTTDSTSFKQVVMVPFPNAETYSIGLVTRENITDLKDPSKVMSAVFVPTTPNPTSGFLVNYPKDKLIYLDMQVEDAFKYIISCGVILTQFKTPDSKESLSNETEI